MDISLQRQSDIPKVEALLDIAFGSDRFLKAAYALREGVEAIEDLSFVIKEKAALIATLRFWQIKAGGEDALLLGPIAVLPKLQGQGYGVGLMRYGLEQAKILGHSRVILVGDESYYAKLNFSRKCAQKIRMPGQDDESRLLALELIDGSFIGVSGILSKCAL